MIHGNLNINGAKRRAAFPTAGLQAIVYDQTYEDGGTTYYRTSLGIGLPVISGTGLDTIIDFSPLNDQRFNKRNYFGNMWGGPAYYNFPYVGIYYDDTDADTAYHWKITDFGYAVILAQSLLVDNMFFLKALATTDTSNVIASWSGLYIYSTALSGNDLSKMKTYIGIQDDFYGGEIFDNHDFSTGNTTGWNFVDCTGLVGTYQGKDNVCLVTATNSVTIYPRQLKTLTLNKTYRIEIEYYIPSVNGFEFDVKYGTSGQVFCSANEKDQWYTETCEAKLTNIVDTGFMSLYTLNTTIGYIYYLKKCSVKESFINYYKS